jgi:hypothetical protein
MSRNTDLSKLCSWSMSCAPAVRNVFIVVLREVDRGASEGMSIYFATAEMTGKGWASPPRAKGEVSIWDAGTKPTDQGNMRVRVVLGDFEPFRRFVASTLEGLRDLQVIGEVSDGLSAVQKAVELRPDLILLDPTPNPEWLRGRSTNSQTCRRVQNNLLESGIFD